MASPTTKYERLGNIFGTPLDILDSNSLPKKAEVVRLWMGLFDTSRTSRNLSPEMKSQVKSKVIKAVVSIWKLKGHTVCSQKTLERKYDRLISEADSLGKNPKCKEVEDIAVHMDVLNLRKALVESKDVTEEEALEIEKNREIVVSELNLDLCISVMYRLCRVKLS